MDKAFFAEFQPITDEQWQQQVLKDLKGAAPETLVWESPEGITVKPYYRATNRPALQVPVRPVGEWLIRQDITVTRETTANAEALDALQRGATALLFKCQGAIDVAALLKDILIEHIHTDWETTDPTVLQDLSSLIKGRGLNPLEVKGSTPQPIVDVLGYFEKYKLLLPSFQLLGIAASNKLTLTEQVAHQLAQANQTVQTLTQAGIPAADVLPHIRFDVEVGTDHFFEIARVRVLRALWLVICRQYVADYALPATIHATNKKTTPEKDGYYEMIRQTTQALSAVIGGVDSLSLVPHVAAPDRSIAFQTRIARNVQLILQHESHLVAIADPAAGSWYLEDLTSQMAEKAWAGFLSLTQLT
jgi:methylmalonyl-CoA mutase